MMLFSFLFSSVRADDELTIYLFDTLQSNNKYPRKMADLPGHLVISDTFLWSYLGKKGAIVLANEFEPNSPKSCLVFGISDVTKLTFGSDLHQSCRFVGKPQVRREKTDFWIFIPVEIDPAGDDRNYISGGINLLFEKEKRSLCSTEGANAELICRRQVSDNFYKLIR